MTGYAPQPRQAVQALLLATLILALTLLFSTVEPPALALATISIAHILFGYYVFLEHGGRFVTPTGLYFAANALFVGLAGILLITTDRKPTEFVLFASIAIFASNLVIFALRFVVGAQNRRSRRRSIFVEEPVVSNALLSWTWKLGIALILLGIGLNVARLRMGQIDTGLAFIGLTSLVLGLVAALRVGRMDRIVPRAMVVGLGMFIFGEVFFSGFGRLTLAALVLAGLIALNVLRNRAWHKHLPLLALIPALVISGVARSAFLEQETTVSQVLLEGQGIESLYNPLEIFGELVEADSAGPSAAFPRQYGATFVDSLLLPIPRAWWQEKPIGFGAKLTQWRTPEYFEAGVSWAALVHGEWYANFGWFGIALFPFVLAFALFHFDAWHLRRLQKPVNTPMDFLWMLLQITLMVGILDYVWVGSSTFVARAGERAIVIGVLALIAAEYRIASPARNRYRR
jgi:hypothetical protein